MAQWRLKQRLETIDFLEDVLQPEVEALKAGKPVLGLEGGVAFDIVIEDENRHSAEVALSDTLRRDTHSADGS